jgi:hypothetical protein
LYIEPDPGGAVGSQHVTLDLTDLLTNFTAVARAARGGGYAANPAAGLPAGDGVINVEDDDSDDGVIAELSLLGTAAWAAAAPAAGQASGSGSSSSNIPPQQQQQQRQQQQQQQQRPSSGASSSGRIMAGNSGPADVATAEADLAALESMNYEPPENMQVREA